MTRGGWRLAALLTATAITAGACSTPNSGSSAQNEQGTASRPRTGVPLPVVAKNVDSCAGLTAKRQGKREDGERLPQITLPCLVAGPTVNLSELRGRPFVINLWATWCGPCREEMPVLQAAQIRYGERVQFLGVNTKDDPARAGDFLQEIGVTYPQVVDLDGELLAFARTPGLPVTLLLNADGRLVGRHVGQLKRDQLDDLIRQSS